MDINGSYAASTFPKVKVGLKSRFKNLTIRSNPIIGSGNSSHGIESPKGPWEPRTTWLSASEALPGHDEWKSNPRAGLMSILEKSLMP